jgi:hypothetical protein
MDYRVQFSALPWDRCSEGIRHKLHRRDARLLRLVEYHASMVPHWCQRGHTGTILSGRFEIEFSAGTFVFEAGDGVDIPAGFAHRHRARVLSDKVVALFVEDVAE